MKLKYIVVLVLITNYFSVAINAQNKASHPRLFFQKDELNALQENRFGTHQEEWKGLIHICEELKKQAPCNEPYWKYVFAFPENLAAVALVQLLDPSQPYQDIFEKHFWNIMNWKHWDNWVEGKGPGPANDLGIAQALIALTACYDWQYDNMTLEQRDFVSQKLIRVAHHFYKDYGRFHSTDFDILNCNHGTNAYASLSAVLYGADNVPDSCSQAWVKSLDHKYDLLTSQMNSNMSDGFSDEGATYFMFQLKTYMQWFELRRNGLQLEAGEPYASLDWFKNTSKYGLYSILPGGDDNFGGLARYADANPKFWGSPFSTLPALAKNLKDPVAQWLANEIDIKGVDSDKRDERSRSYKYDVWRYIGKDGHLASIDLETLPNWHFFEDAGMYVWRSSWNNDASYFTIKSGQHYQGHGQPDDGQFMIHRAGIPYIIDMGYSKPKFTHEHNVLLVNGEGQVGDGDIWCDFGSYPENKNVWGKTDMLISTGIQKGSDYFNLLSDPTNMYPSKALDQWTREVVGLNGVFVIRDQVKTSELASLELLLHAYTSRKGDKDAYEYKKDRDINPFKTSGIKEWYIDPRNGEAPRLLVKDLSATSWSDSIDEAWVYDKYEVKHAKKGYVRLGNVLRRKQQATNTSSLVFFGFEDELEGKKITSLQDGEGVAIRNNKKLETLISWTPEGAGSQLQFNGQMAGASWNGKQITDWFARAATVVSSKKSLLFQSDKAVSVHATVYSSGMLFTISAEVASEVTIGTKKAPTKVILNGKEVKFTVVKKNIKVLVEKGENQKLELTY